MNENASLTQTTNRMLMALTFLGLTGIAWPFLPYAADGGSILEILSDSVVVEYWPAFLFCFVLPVPISVGYALWLKTGRLPRWWTLINYLLAAAIAVSCLAFWIMISQTAVSVWFAFPLAGAAWLLLQGVNSDSTPRGLLAMQAVYAVSMTFWLVQTFGVFQIGAWLGAATLLVYLGQILLVLKRYRWSLSLLVPLVIFGTFVQDV